MRDILVGDSLLPLWVVRILHRQEARFAVFVGGGRDVPRVSIRRLEGKAVRHLTIKEDLQRVVARGSSALVHVDEVVAEKRAHRAWIDASRSWRRNQVRRAPIVDKVGDGGLID